MMGETIENKYRWFVTIVWVIFVIISFGDNVNAQQNVDEFELQNVTTNISNYTIEKPFPLKIMTYNVWHFDSPIAWEERLPLIVKIVSHSN